MKIARGEIGLADRGALAAELGVRGGHGAVARVLAGAIHRYRISTIPTPPRSIHTSRGDLWRGHGQYALPVREIDAGRNPVVSGLPDRAPI